MYRLSQNGVKHLEKEMYIPNDPANRHWQEYQKWLEAGNTPEPELTLEVEMISAQTTPSPRFAEFRRMEYFQEGLTFDRWNELTIEEDQAGLADYRTKRDAIRSKYPKYTE